MEESRIDVSHTFRPTHRISIRARFTSHIYAGRLDKDYA